MRKLLIHDNFRLPPFNFCTPYLKLHFKVKVTRYNNTFN